MKNTVLALLLSCFNTAFSQSPDPAAIALLKSLNDEIWTPFSVSWKEGDVEKYLSLHSKDFVRCSGGESRHISNLDEYAERNRARFKLSRQRGEQTNISFRFTERVVNPVTASERGIYHYEFADAKGQKRDGYGQFHVIERREKGRWKFLVDYDSDEGGSIGEADWNAAYAPDDWAVLNVASDFGLRDARLRIETANLNYGERFRTGDPEFYKARYTADASIMPEKMERINGRDAIRDYYYNNGQNQGFTIKIVSTEITGSKEGIVEEGIYELFDTLGHALDKGKFLATWVLEDKQWKLRREIWTTDLPDMQAAPEAGFDSLLAKKLDADDYGMKRYVLVLLKTGPTEIQDKTTVDSLFAGHMANIGRLAAEQKLVLAGPIGRKEKYRGLFVFNVATIEEAKALTATDPAIKAGLLEPEFMPYYGSAALRMVNEWHERVQKKKF